MRGQFLLAELSQRVWALPPDRARVYAEVMRRAVSQPASPEVLVTIRADTEAREARRASAAAASNGAVAVIPVYGIITQRGNLFDDLSAGGSASTQILTQQIREAIADETVGAIVLDINSPGGDCFGTQECADEIYAARAKKPIVAYSNALAASAAYWLGSQATEFHVTPSGEVGSIGVISAHEDYSKLNETIGVSITYIFAGKFKTEFNPNAPLSQEAISFAQSRVDAYYSAFTKAVARGRGVPIAQVRSDMGEGRCFGADQALAAKMVDAISTFDEIIKRARSLIAPAVAKPAAAATASVIARKRNEFKLLG